MTGATIFGCAGPALTRDERAFFREADPWGFILFDRNLPDRAAILRLTAELRAAVGRDAPILIDQEGGRVQRLRPPLARDWRPALDDVARHGPRAEEAMRLRAAIIGTELRALGIDVNCVPLGDVATDATHPVLRNRCYSDDPARVAALARAVADGCLAAGVLPVVKHIPGHGRGTADSHVSLPVVDAARDLLDRTDFLPFRALADLPLGMTSHVVYSAIDAAPATVSLALIRVIREEIGFGGLLMTDDLTMEALGGSLASRAARAIAAGCDVILHCDGDATAMVAVAGAAGAMTAAAESRAAAALSRRLDAPDVDIAGLTAMLDALEQEP